MVRAAVSATVAFSILLLAGCAHESVIGDTTTRRPQEKRPDWTYTPPPALNGKAYFVGRSTAVNILDERSAMNLAIDDAIYQIARAAGAEVTGTANLIDRRSGEAVRGKEKTSQPSDQHIRVNVQGTVIGIQQEDTFFERVSVREKFLGKEHIRYKNYVLISVPEKELEELRAHVKKKNRHP